MTDLQFISLTDDTGRVSSLQIDGIYLKVIGNLPHNTRFRLTDAASHRLLTQWLADNPPLTKMRFGDLYQETGMYFDWNRHPQGWPSS